ncbi:glutathione S-transferase N-terminal domain-containing protein [Bradyrhizobium mercantei]|uniref:glutathione S-transferase N-terminal domain-containing protein n=1 Tax=Bradyrhizobium mercantei TaxID=1904807 RepID=UPI000978C309|nr:glutathione S-transferase N-terminal domain-containing protein [Bradyrhizobium mercantei]
MQTAKLLTAYPSPFGHKVQCAAAIVGFEIRLEFVSTLEAGSELRRVNPLGKLPVLVPVGCEPIYDSSVIVEYLQLRTGTTLLIPRDSQMRLSALRAQALADGLAEAAVLIYSEFQWREPPMRNTAWLAHQAEKMVRCLDHLEGAQMLNPRATAERNIGTIALGCTLNYLALRFGNGMANRWPRTFSWVEHLARDMEEFASTAPLQQALHLKYVPADELFGLLRLEPANTTTRPSLGGSLD